MRVPLIFAVAFAIPIRFECILVRGKRDGGIAGRINRLQLNQLLSLRADGAYAQKFDILDFKLANLGKVKGANGEGCFNVTGAGKNDVVLEDDDL